MQKSVKVTCLLPAGETSDIGLQVSASVCAAAAAEQLLPNGAIMNGGPSHDHGMSTEALLRSLKPLLDPTADVEVPASVEEAALVAVGSLGSSPAAASLFFVDEQRLPHDVAVIALGRAGAIAANECLSTNLSGTSWCAFKGIPAFCSGRDPSQARLDDTIPNKTFSYVCSCCMQASEAWC